MHILQYCSVQFFIVLYRIIFILICLFQAYALLFRIVLYSTTQHYLSHSISLYAYHHILYYLVQYLYYIISYSIIQFLLPLTYYISFLYKRKKNSILFYPIPSHWLSWDHHTLISMSLPIQPSHSFQLMFLNWWWLVEVVGGCVRCSNYSSYYYFYYIALCLQSTCHQFRYLLVLLCSAQPYLLSLSPLLIYIFIYLYIYPMS